MTCISNVLTWHLLHVLSFPLSSSYFLSSVLSMDPVIGAISAGNAVVLKPSEISPATSSLLANLIEQYLDNSTIRVVEGAIPETSALLDQKWDKILQYLNFNFSLFGQAIFFLIFQAEHKVYTLQPHDFAFTCKYI